LENAYLLLYAAYEKKVNGIRIWYINQHKGFIFRNQLKANAELINPIRIPLHNIQLNKKGAYE
jgi:hypothetical protein